MAITKSKQSAINSKLKIARRKLKSAAQDKARRAPGADVRVATHSATIARLSTKGRPAVAAGRA